ncbi:hypothetical protein RR46_03911 [Papilio xuthus]|uniref:EF-hand calcium-binding domain-containing protein 6 n=1 Tax=Papilio xuthus TaxID=66420 RepID=A0A194Q1X5_PAPXU|nr:hypothetical protein RR46_03911 [Papilio xuthus]
MGCGADASDRSRTSADCILEACPPPPEPRCHTLDQWQTRRLCCLLATIAARDLPLRPYFQDYELVAKNDGRITFAHFARILHFVGVILSPEDFNLIVRRFIKDSYTIDYVEFLKAVEAVKKEGIQGLGPAYQHPGAVLDTTLPKLSRPEVEAGRPGSLLGTEVFHPALQPPRPPRALLDVMLRVQEFVLQRRIRVSEYFRDFDALNSGRIMPQQFRRAMDAMGLGSVISEQEAACIVRHYLDPNDKERVCWRPFEDDCDQVFTVKELEKHPEVDPGAMAAVIAELPASGSAAEKHQVTNEDLDLAEAALLRIRAACKERTIDLRPIFGDYDKRRCGHVSRSVVRSALSRGGVLPAPAHMRALEARYLDDCGFNFIALLNDLEERPVESATVARALPPVGTPHAAHDPAQTDIVQILAKIKGRMVLEGLRPRDYLRQFDKHNELVIARPDFYRGMASAGFVLTPLEMDTVMDVFCAPTRRRYIDYDRFCRTVGEALAQEGLERAPLLQPVPHAPPPPTNNFLNFEERSIVSKALDKLSKHHDQVSNIFEIFKEADREQCGSVPQVAVQRALSRRGVLALLSARELQLICKCFGYRRGCGDEVDYRALCTALELVHATTRAQPC